MNPCEHLPGERARYSGDYEERNVFDTATGKRIYVDQGAILPVLPRGFTWRLVMRDGERGSSGEKKRAVGERAHQ